MTTAMLFVSFLGSAAFYVPVLLVVFWCVSSGVGARAAVILLLGAEINTILKLVFHAPRPYWTDPGTKGYDPEVSYGMPSGHAENAALSWGFLGAVVRRPVVWVVATAMIVLIGVSRVYLGAHSLGQVLAGWAVGAGLLLAALRLTPAVLRWWRGRRLAAQLGLSLVVSLAFLGLTALALDDLPAARLPNSWVRAMAAAGVVWKPATLHPGVTAAGTIFGLLAGLSWLECRGWFDAGGELWRRLVRIPLGLAGVVVLWYAFGLLVPHGESPLAFTAAYIRYGAVAFWFAGGAPELFVRLRLAARDGRMAPPRSTQPG